MGVEPNPQVATINKGAEEARKFGADAILAFGGGSVMDASKAIGVLLHMNEYDVWPYVGGEAKAGQITGSAPIITIPTTAATASEVTPFAVISNDKVHGKSGMGHESMKPKLSWINPVFTTNLPTTTTRDGAADIMSHVFENYLLGGNASPLADRYSEGVLETVLNVLPDLVKDPQNVALRAQMFWASDLALNGYQMAGRQLAPFVLHAMEHALSGYKTDLAHGRGLATLYPAYFRWLWENGRVHERLEQLGNRLFNIHEMDQSKAALEFIEQFEDWLRENELYQSIPDLGIPENAYRDIAEYAIRSNGRNGSIEAAGPLTADDIVEIFKLTHRQSVNAPV
jgi:hypothetical protein